MQVLSLVIGWTVHLSLSGQVMPRDVTPIPPSVLDWRDPLSITESAVVFETNFFSVPEYRPLQFIPFRLESPPVPDKVVVRFSVVGGTATEGQDYWIDRKVFEFAAPSGASIDSILRLVLNDSDEKEPDETILLDASIDGVTNDPVRIEVLIRDGQSPGQVGFVSSRFSANESSGGAAVRLFRTQNSRTEGNVTLTVDGDAGLLGVFPESRTLVVHFGADDTQVSLPVPLVNDALTQGYRDLRFQLLSGDSGLTLIPELSTTVLTVADDESAPELGRLDIRRYVSEDKEGVILSLSVPRGFRSRIEYTDSMLGENWTPLTDVYGADTEGLSFDSFQSGIQRMYRATGLFPSDITLPW
jgi:Calx-beta domain